MYSVFKDKNGKNVEEGARLKDIATGEIYTMVNFGDSWVPKYMLVKDIKSNTRFEELMKEATYKNVEKLVITMEKKEQRWRNASEKAFFCSLWRII